MSVSDCLPTKTQEKRILQPYCTTMNLVEFNLILKATSCRVVCICWIQISCVIRSFHPIDFRVSGQNEFWLTVGIRTGQRKKKYLHVITQVDTGFRLWSFDINISLDLFVQMGFQWGGYVFCSYVVIEHLILFSIRINV